MNPLRRKSFIYMAATAIGLAAVSVATSGLFFTGYTWTGANNSQWNNGLNWLPAGVPNTAADTATLALPGAINLDISPTIMWVDVQNSGTTLNLGSNTLTLTDPLGLKNAGNVRASGGTGTINGNITNLAGASLIANQNCILALNSPTIANAGNILVNHTGSFDATLRFVADSHVSGTGTIQLNGDTDGDRIETSGAATLFNEGGHTIMGRGAMAALLNNSSTVSANVNGGTLHMIEKNVTNSGTMKATNGGGLRISGITVNNAGGTLLADGGDIALDGSTLLIGGSIDRTGASAVRGSGPATLQDVTIQPNGAYIVNQSTTTLLKGSSLTNNGLFMVNHTGSFDSTVVADDDIAIGGNGVMWINGDTTADFLGTSAGKTVTNGANHTIRGRGAITGRLNNNGTVQADVSGWNFDMMTEAKSNQGMMQALNGGVLRFMNIAVNNAGGLIRNLSGTVHVGNGTTIMSGILQGGITQIGNAVLQDVTIDSAGHYGLNQNTTTTLMGSSLVNDGLITINLQGSFDAAMIFASNITLSGGGLLRINGDTTSDTIDTSGGFALTHANSHTIKGRGSIKADISNNGLIEADVNGATLEMLDKQKHNGGVMRAVNGGILRFGGVNVDNGGRIEANGGTVFFSGTNKIAGGNISSTGASFLQGEGPTTFVNTQLDAGSEYRVRNNSTTTFEGSFFTNNGKFLINNVGSFDAALIANSNVTVGGSGHIELNGDTDNDTIDTNGSFVLTNAMGHKIHGRGSLKGKITNNGTVEADVSGWALRLLDKPKKNANLYKSSTNSTLFIGVPVDNLNGTIEANGGVVHLGAGSSITQGLLTGPNNFEAVGNTSLADLVIDSGTTYRVFNNTTTTLTGANVTNNGTIIVNHVGSFDANLSADGDVQLLGNGNVQLNGDTATDRVSTTAGSKLTIGSNQTVHGRGSVQGHIENKGTIRSGVSGWWLVLTGEESGILNTGLIEPTNGARIDVTNGALFENAGDVTVAASQLLRVLANNYRQTDGTTTVNGTLQILNGDVVLEGGELMGTGTVSGDVDNATGNVSPGNSAGTLTVQGAYNQSNTGLMTVEVADATNADKLVMSGACTLNGTLDIVLLDGFIPADGAQYEIISAGSLSGNFSKVQLDKLPDTVSAELLVVGNKVFLKFSTSAGTVVNPTSYFVTNSTSTSPVGNLFGSDNTYVTMPAGMTPSSITVQGTAPAMTVNWLEIVVEHAVSKDTLPETVELFDYINNSWIEVDAHVSTTTDARVRLAVALNPNRFIQTGTRQMQIRISNTPGMVNPKGAKRGARYDQVIWRLR